MLGLTGSLIADSVGVILLNHGAKLFSIIGFHSTGLLHVQLRYRQFFDEDTFKLGCDVQWTAITTLLEL